MKDKGTGAENLIWLAGRQSGRPDSSLLAADDILAALTGRIAELEARVSEILADVESELPRADAKPGGARTAPKSDAGSADNVSRDALVEASAELSRASEERRMLANEMRLLREAIQGARGIQIPAGPGANPVEARIAPDLQIAIADEMRSLLTELLADFRARPAIPPAVVDRVPATTERVEDVVVNAPIFEPLVEAAATASPPGDALVTEAAPIDAVESVIEHVDELERPAASGPIVDEYVEDLRGSRPLAPADPPRVEDAAPEPATPIVDAYVEELRAAEPLESVETFDVIESPEPASPIVDEALKTPETVAPMIDERLQALLAFQAPPDVLESSAPPPEASAPIIDEDVFEPQAASEPTLHDRVDEPVAPESPLWSGFESTIQPTEKIEPIADEDVSEPLEASDPITDERLDALLGFEASSPQEMVESTAPEPETIDAIVDPYVGDVQPPDSALPLDVVETSAPQAEPSVEDFVEDLRQPEPFVEPIGTYFAPAGPTPEAQITPPPLPAEPDARIDALWNAAASWSKSAETEPAQSFEPPPFITEGSVPEAQSFEVPEAEANTWAEPLRETPTEFIPPPPMDFAPAPPTEFAPDAAAIPEPAPPVEPISLDATPQPSFAAMFPELRVADERGLHQIQVVISPIHSFPRLLETERRIRALSTVNALHLRDFRNGIATLTVSVGEAISPAEFGAVIQMLEELHLRLEGTTQSSVELRAEDEPPTG